MGIFDEISEEEVDAPTPEADVTEVAEESDEKTSSWGDFLETETAVRRIYLAFGGAVIVLLMTLLQFSTNAVCCGDWDGYYHIRWSQLLWENISSFKWLPNFEWLPLTILNSGEYADHHFAFHLLQIPFLWFFEPVTAAKVAAVVYGSLAIFSVYWLLYKYRVKYLLVWLLAILACANPFLYRMNMAKAPPLTIIYSVVGIYLLFERKYIWLMPLMFIFVWTYSLFPLLLVAACIWVAVVYWNEKKFEWQALAYTTGGMVLGNVINPYFPSNVYLFIDHLLMKFRAAYEVPVGNEWYPYSSWAIITHLTVAMIAMLVGYILYKSKGDSLPSKATFFLVFGTILLIWMFKSKRLAEYFPPFAILFAAFSWEAFIRKETPILPEDFRRDIEQLLDAEDKEPQNKTFTDWIRSFAPWAIGTALACSLIFNIAGERLGLGKQTDLLGSIKSNQADDKYGEAMDWASKNFPKGDRIFNCNWDDFPKLFYLNTKHSYVWGLDPNYLYTMDPDLYDLTKKATQGKLEEPGPFIKDELEADWFFTDEAECKDLAAQLQESGWAEIVHEDGEAFIFRIRDEQGDPPETVEPESKEEEDELDKSDDSESETEISPTLEENNEEDNDSQSAESNENDANE